MLHSNKGGCGFRNSKLEGLSDEYIKLRDQYENDQKIIVEETAQVAGVYTFHSVLSLS